MAKKITKQQIEPKPEKVQKLAKAKGSKAKTPKFKLISYEVGAVISTGAYSNIQPKVIVQAETLEQAERAVMPHIEALFAKYRDGGGKPMVVTGEKVVPDTSATLSTGKNIHTHPDTPAIVMSVPMTRAQTAINSCTSLEALDLVMSQVQKSEKLIENEKADLFKIIEEKRKKLNG